jgi:membrane protein CcdC involved in cytochrome C biogenesis
MSTTQWILNCGLLAWVLLRNLGTRPVTRATYLTPMVVVVAAALVFLRHVPTAGHDVTLEVAGLLAGVAFGLLATALTRFEGTASGVAIKAGAAFAALWILVIGGRVAFAEWANGPGARTIGEFSVRHQITGADAWTAAFVLMALAMVAARLLSTAAWTRMRHTRPAEVDALSAA